jgi:hypothetical protein
MLQMVGVDDEKADRMTGPKKARSAVKFHATSDLHPRAQFLEAMVVGSHGDSHSTAFSCVCLRYSHRYHALFGALKSMGGEGAWSHLSDLNRRLADPECRARLQDALGATYDIPLRVDACCVPMDKPCLVLMHPAVVRCDVVPGRDGDTRPPNTTRVVARYLVNCGNEPIHATRNVGAESYEADTFAPTAPVWPLSTPASTLLADTGIECVCKEVRDTLDADGVVVLELEAQRVGQHMRALHAYLHTLVRPSLPPGCASPDDMFRALKAQPRLRHAACPRSSHVPRNHGHTGYGHHCQASMDIYRDISPFIEVLMHSLGSETGLVTTFDLVVKL